MKKCINKILSTTIILSLMLSCASCTNKNNISINNKTPNNTINNNFTTNNNSNKNNDDEIEISTINEDDFIIKYEDINITVGKLPENLFDTIGEGTAGKNNNWGFIGYDDNKKYKYYSHGYPADTPNFFIRTRTKITDGSVIISDIDVSKIGTNKDIKIDNSAEDIVKSYGNADKILDYDDNITNYKYFYENKILDFYLDSNTNKVNQIIIRYNDNHENTL